LFLCYFIVLDPPDEPNGETDCRRCFYSFKIYCVVIAYYTNNFL